MAYEWVNDLKEIGTDALIYLENNQWAADALKGGAAAGLQYMAQKDQQEFEERQQQRRWNRDDSLMQAPDIDFGGYDYSSGLVGGPMTNGGLINRGRTQGV